MMGGKMSGVNGVVEEIHQVFDEFSESGQVIPMENFKYFHELDLVWDLFSVLVDEGEVSLAIYDDEKLVVIRGSGHVPDSLPSSPNNQIEPVRVQADSGLLLIWRRSVHTRSLALLVSIPDDGMARQNDKALLALGKTGIHLVAQAFYVHWLSRRVRQSVRERDVVSGLIGDGLLVLDQSGFLRYINDLGKKILRIDDERQKFRDLLGFEPVISDVFQRREGYVDRKVIIPVKGVNTSLTDTAIPIMDDHGAIVSVVNIFRKLAPEQALAEQSIKKEMGVRIVAIMGESDTVKNMKDYALQVARSTENVLIYGEPGTGKSLLAKAIHGESANKERHMMVVDCARLSVHEFESHVLSSRAVRGEPGWVLNSDISGASDVATLLFEGIDFLPISTQLRLFSALVAYRQLEQPAGVSGPPRLRIMASVSDAIGVIIQEQRLHPKLHGFLSEMNILAPPLRSREGDLPRYVASFLQQEAAGAAESAVSGKLLRFLGKQAWVGNLVQLRFVVRELLRSNAGSESDRRMIGKVEEIMGVSHIPFHFSVQNFERLSMSEAEKQAIYLALQAMDFNLSRAAQVLGISRPTLYSKMKKYKLGQ
ncbi:AAA family ATPase [Pigmentiphaga aceris]|uniref:AAA family ATPase n=1 Tax=Pigmentiphaga aceris TaxID=1940612 RepID=A0A5C0AUT5_9BURK|nr:sigma 54-interacting transcriptional regulator [Pigmentiphaga aceris]QEI06098.1 AAA family ATPase [Pigmentiphaga aceris]